MNRETPRQGRAALAAWMTAGALSAAGCSDGGLPGGTDGATGTIRVSLADSPYPFDLIRTAELTVDQVSVRYQGDDAGGFLVLGDELRTVNLLDLRNGVTTLLVEAEVPAGTIDQLRLRVVDAGVTLTDGREFPLEVPSGETSGLKADADPPIVVAGGLTADLLLDVDVSRSFLAVPAAPRRVDDVRGFHFKPVVRVANLSESGSISGHVRSDAATGANPSDDVPLAGATVTAMLGGTDYATATDPDGFYRLMGLPPGTHTVTVFAEGHQPDGLSVPVVAGNDAGGTDFLLMETAGSAGLAAPEGSPVR
jgi:hypothetical protein